MAETQAEPRGDGVFVTGVVLLVAVMLFALGFAGLGGADYGPFAIVLMVSAGGASYFALRGAGEFGMKQGEGVLLAAGIALAGALAFAVLFVRGYPVLSSIAAAVALACAAPIVGLVVRSMMKAKVGGSAPPAEPVANS